MSLAVVIVSHNSGTLLVECVLNVLAARLPDRVIVSDNVSTDCSIEAVEQLAHADSRLQVLKNGANIGFGAANNRALALLGNPAGPEDLVLLLNPDCLVQENTLNRMVDVLRAYPDAAMAGCLIRNADGSEEVAAHRHLPTPATLLADLMGQGGRKSPEMATQAGPLAVEAISGAFMLIRRQVLTSLGAFDEGYFMHWEDLDLCRRIGDAGYSILYVPDVEVLHYKGHSSQSRPYFVEWHKHLGLMRYLRKFHFSGGRVLFYPPVPLAVAGRYGLQVLRRYLVPRRAPGPLPSFMAVAARPEIWVLGASSLVGRRLLPRLVAAGYQVRAFSRDPHRAGARGSPHLAWEEFDLGDLAQPLPPSSQPVAVISLAPIFALPPWLPALSACGIKKILAFSSTSAISKANSPIDSERRLAHSLSAAEDALRSRCVDWGMSFLILRPTMIYALGEDKNISRLARIIRWLGFFPLPGAGTGLRQPVHADDLADACVKALNLPAAWDATYVLSGGEVLSYRVMLERIFRKLGRSPRIIHPPFWMWRLALIVAGRMPGFADVNAAMLQRINQDLSFDHQSASQAFGYAPRQFLQ